MINVLTVILAFAVILGTRYRFKFGINRDIFVYIPVTSATEGGAKVIYVRHSI